MHATRRALLALLLALGACGTSDPPKVTTGAFTVEEVVVKTDDALRIDVHRREVPVEKVLAELLPRLPVTGLADVSIDVTIPRHGDTNLYGGARGSVAIGCARCTLGQPGWAVQTAAARIPFGQLDLGRVELRAELADGILRLEQGAADSKDLTVRSALTIRLADQLDASTLDGCVRFKPDPSLAQRAPETHAALVTTGAALGPDGFYSIKLGGTLDDRKLIAAPCPGSDPT